MNSRIPDRTPRKPRILARRPPEPTALEVGSVYERPSLWTLLAEQGNALTCHSPIQKDMPCPASSLARPTSGGLAVEWTGRADPGWHMAVTGPAAGCCSLWLTCGSEGHLARVAGSSQGLAKGPGSTSACTKEPGRTAKG